MGCGLYSSFGVGDRVRGKALLGGTWRDIGWAGRQHPQMLAQGEARASGGPGGGRLEVKRVPVAEVQVGFR